MIPASLPRSFLRTVIAAGFVLALAGCASAPTGQNADANDANDPLEIPNRFVFAVNEAADILVIRPAAEVYRGAVPDPIRDAVQNILNNLLSPIIITNELLQGDGQGAQNAAGRFLTNTILGLGGVLDVATQAGIPPYAYEDFGQTLGVWGLGEGPYLVLPLLGPSNLRDATGFAVDTVADPVRLWAYGADAKNLLYLRGGTTAVNSRSLVLTQIDDLRRNSLDFYATLRSLYHQRREAEIRDREGATETPEFPEFDNAPAPAPTPMP
ncbi:MAG TPA: VacJ family lipoprotein [Azospirillum sp.]|nr:VacJ family lipoprotein [Azospirillum sp.]